jgi:hypothetical protein
MLHSATLGNLPGVSKPRLRALFDIVNELRRARFIARPRPWYAANRLHCEMEAAVALASMRDTSKGLRRRISSRRADVARIRKGSRQVGASAQSVMTLSSNRHPRLADLAEYDLC